MAKKTTAIQVSVFDLANNPLPERLIRELEASVTTLLKQHATIAHTVTTS